MKRKLISSKILVAGVVITLVLAACGSAFSGKTPTQVLTQAFTQLSKTSFKADFNGNIKIDMTNLHLPSGISLPSGLPAPGSSANISFNGTIQFKDAKNFSATASAMGKTVDITVYQGTGYVSTDNGSTYSSLGSISSSATPSSFDFSNLLNFQDKGTTTQDGLNVEDYSATVTEANLNNVLSKVASQLGNQLSGSNAADISAGLTILEKYISLSGTTVDTYVNTQNNNLDRINVNVNISVQSDLFKLISQSASKISGSLTVAATFDIHTSNFGQSFTITKPANVSSGFSNSLGNSFGSSPGSSLGNSFGNSLGNGIGNNLNNLGNGLSG